MPQKIFNPLLLSLIFAGFLLSCTSGNVISTTTNNSPTTYAYVITISGDESGNYFNKTLTYKLSSNGELVPTDNAAVDNDINADAIVTNPKLPYAYIVNADGGTVGGSVAMYRINSNGELAALNPSLVGAGFKPYSLAISSNANYGYVTNDDSTISMYSIIDGALSPLTPESNISEEFGSSKLVITPNNKYAYVNNFFNNTISMYNILASGALSPMAESTVQTQAFPYSLAMHPSGKYLYSVNRNDNSINMFSINGSGLLQALQPESYIVTDPLAKLITINANETTAYVLNDNSTILAYSINNNGILERLPESPVQTGLVPQNFVLDPNGKYGYAVSLGYPNVNIYSIGSNGSLTQTFTESFGYFNNSIPVNLAFYTSNN